MTATNFFGKPNKRWYRKHKEQRCRQTDKEGVNVAKKDK